MRPNRDPLPPRSSWKKIEELSRRVADPASYLRGRMAEDPVVPRNILCFVRRRAEALTRSLFQPPEQHHRFVLIAALRGAGEICLDADRFLIGEKQVQFFFPFQFHSYLSVHPSRICWVFITFEMEKGTGLESLRSSPSRNLGRIESGLLEEVVRSWTAGEAPGLLQARLALLLASLAGRKPEKVSGSGGRGGPEEDLLFRVNRQVLAGLDKPLDIKTMAAALGLSESHLRRRFRLATGLSLGRHLRELRMQRACALLQNQALSVGEVAGRCGFDTIYSFSRAFKNSLRLSPRGYRRRLKAPG